MNDFKYKQYLVKILFNSTDGTHYGSGVIVKPFEYSDYLYIFTAKHTFEEKIRDKEYPDDVDKVLFSNEYIKENLVIELYNGHNKSTCHTKFYPDYINNITKVISVDEELDLLIFEISIKDNPCDIDVLRIHQGIFNKAIVAGFPSIRDGSPYGYDSSFLDYYENETHKHIELKSNDILFTHEIDEYNAIKGISGGGVFIEKNEEIYLVGIEVEYQAPNSFKCINLQAIYCEIDSILKSRTDIRYIPIYKKDIKYFSLEIIEINLSNTSLYVSKYPVTFGEYDLFCADIGREDKKPSSEGFGRRKNPVINVSWNDAIEYCKWLSSGENTFELLSLDDWINISNQVKLDNDNIWFERNIIEVDKLTPNNLGLYHFYGNINEWCSDDNDNIRIAIGGSCIEKKLHRQKRKLPSITSSEIGFRIKQVVI